MTATATATATRPPDDPLKAKLRNTVQLALDAFRHIDTTVTNLDNGVGLYPPGRRQLEAVPADLRNGRRNRLQQPDGDVAAWEDSNSGRKLSTLPLTNPEQKPPPSPAPIRNTVRVDPATFEQQTPESWPDDPHDNDQWGYSEARRNGHRDSAVERCAGRPDEALDDRAQLEHALDIIHAEMLVVDHLTKKWAPKQPERVTCQNHARHGDVWVPRKGRYLDCEFCVGYRKRHGRLPDANELEEHALNVDLGTRAESAIEARGLRRRIIEHLATDDQIVEEIRRIDPAWQDRLADIRPKDAGTVPARYRIVVVAHCVNCGAENAGPNAGDPVRVPVSSARPALRTV